MTAKELYEKLVSMGLENVELRVQYRDEGDDYYGYDSLGDEGDDYYGYDSLGDYDGYDSLGDEEDYGRYYGEKENVIYV